VATTKTFVEDLYVFWCDVKEDGPGTFVCAITFASSPFGGPLKTTIFKVDGAFSSAKSAMRAGEHQGRKMIRKHGDVIRHLAAKSPQS
jgi:hypothetical protein